MRVLLLTPNTEQINMPVMPLGLACVAESSRQAGHEVALIDLMFEPDPGRVLAEQITAFRPDCIGVSVRNIDDQNMASARFLLDEVRERIEVCRRLSTAPVVLGGAGYSIYPRSSLAYLGADMGIAGEGEAVFPELLARMERGRDVARLPGLYIRGNDGHQPRRTVEALHTLKLPGADLLSASASRSPDPWIPVQTRRGCAFNCSYCTTPVIEGTRLRRRPPEQVMGWLQAWVEAGYRNFFFVDNTFNLPADYARELCRQIIDARLDIRWQAIIYPQRVDAALVRLMAEAGCVHISLGYESGSGYILKRMNKRFTPDEVRVVAERFGEHGIERMGFLLLGSPGETRETVEESLVFSDSLRLEMLNITAGVRICPNTPLAQQAQAEGVAPENAPLLRPRFYLAPGLEDWLPDRLTDWAASHPNVMI